MRSARFAMRLPGLRAAVACDLRRARSDAPAAITVVHAAARRTSGRVHGAYLSPSNELHGSMHNPPEKTAMKSFLTALVALSVIAGAAGQSFATPSNVNAKTLFDRLDKEGRGGHQN